MKPGAEGELAPALRLPLWRAIAGFGVLASFLVVIAALAPTYVENYQLTRYVRTLAAAPDNTLRSEVLARAHELRLPVEPGDIHITHDAGKLQLRTKYRVQMNLSLYSVDLHLEANTR